MKDRELIVKDGKAICRIGDTEGCQLVAVYVMMTTSWGLPAVAYIEIFGKGPDGSDVYEKKLN